MFERLFKLRAHNTTAAVEILAGLATFMTMAYILAVNPSILRSAFPGGDAYARALFTATAIGAVIATLLMAFWANMPFALAPGMGLNAFFAYVVVAAKGYSWQEALTAVFVSGILFLVLTLVGAREALVRGFPEALKHAVGASLGLMIAAIGLKNAGVIDASGAFWRLGDIRHGGPLLALIGIVVTCVLMALKVKGGILIGMAVTTVIGIPLGVTTAPPPAEGVFSMPPDVTPIAFAFSADWQRLLTPDFIVVVFTFLFVDIFDSLGTFMGVLTRIGGDASRYDTRIKRALLCDAVGTIAGSCAGTSTVTTYVESSAGVSAGGRTGLTALTVAVLFVLAAFFSPLFLMVPAAATAPAMVIVGMFLAAVAVKINFEDFSEGVPAVVCILVTALTSSISDGLMFGWVGIVLVKILTGRVREMNAISLVMAAIFLAKMALL